MVGLNYSDMVKTVKKSVFSKVDLSKKAGLFFNTNRKDQNKFQKIDEVKIRLKDFALIQSFTDFIFKLDSSSYR